MAAGADPTAPLLPPAPLQPKPPAASTEQSFPPETLQGTSLCSWLPPRPRRQESAFECAPWLPPAAGSLGDAMVGTVWGGLDRGYLRPRSLPFPWAGGGDGDKEAVAVVFVVVLWGRDGRRLFPREGIATPGLMEACILLDPEGKVGVRHQPRSWLSGQCGYCKTHSCWNGASLGNLDLARAGKGRI